MTLDDYEFIDPKGTAVGVDLERLANQHPARAGRLIDWLENCVINEASRDLCVVGENAEVYLVPPRFLLSNLPDAAALMRVDHSNKKIELVKVMELYGGYGEAAQWDAITKVAQKAVKG